MAGHIVGRKTLLRRGISRLATLGLLLSLTGTPITACSSGDLTGTSSVTIAPSAATVPVETTDRATVTAGEPTTASTEAAGGEAASGDAASNDAVRGEAALFPIRADGKWGYIDRQGRVVVEPQYDEAYPFSEGLGRIGIDQETVGKFGFVDATGATAIEPQFSWASDFSEGLALARATVDGASGYIDKTGTWAIEPRFANAAAFSEGLAPAQLDGHSLTGCIDQTGAFVIEPRFRDFIFFCEGLAAAETTSVPGVRPKKGYVDKTGEFVIEPRFYKAERFSEGLAPVALEDSSSEDSSGVSFGYIDKTGALVFTVCVPEVEPVASLDYSFSEGLAAWVGADGRAGYIDKAGSFVIAPQFVEATRFSEGLAAVCLEVNTDTWGYIDKTGAWVIQPQFKHAEPFADGLARVHLGADQAYVLAYVDPEGQVVWQGE